MKDLEEKIRKYYQKYYQSELGLPNWQELVNFRVNEEEFEREKILRLEKLLGEFAGKKILDVGCGTGGFLAEAAKKGAMVFGIDPEKEAVKICHLKGIKNVKVGFGENLPYGNNFFDVAYCYTVLEHVENPEKTLSEMVRVAKPAGKIYLQTPNYLSCYEGHYKIFWLPLFPKFLAKIYLFLRGRSSKFLETINYLTPGKLLKFSKSQPVRIHFINHSLGKPSKFLEKIIFTYYKLFKIDPQIEVVLKKE